MPWIVYETRNAINGKIYVGVAKTTRRNFKYYLGSGTAIRKALAKYGRDNFTRTTLFEFEEKETAYAVEAMIVTTQFCLREDTYNAKTGGSGGHGHSMPDSAKQAIAEYQTNRLKSDEERARIASSLRGRKRSEETIAKMRLAASTRPSRPTSEETRRLLSERQKAAWARGRKTHQGDAAT